MMLSIGESSSFSFVDFAQLVTATATLLVAWFAYRTSRSVANEQNRISIESSRAYLVPGRTKLERLNVGEPVSISRELKCFGATPALEIRVCAKNYVGHPDDVHDMEIPDNAAEMLLVPGQTMKFGFQGETPLVLSLSEMEELIAGTKLLYSAILVEYVDMAGRIHRTFHKCYLVRQTITTSQIFKSTKGCLIVD